MTIKELCEKLGADSLTVTYNRYGGSSYHSCFIHYGKNCSNGFGQTPSAAISDAYRNAKLLGYTKSQNLRVVK